MSAIWDFPPTDAPLDLKPTIAYRVHCPKMTLLTGKNFHYFKLRLFDIKRFFHEKKSWNRDYPAAQQIYSDSPTSATLRTAIATEHSILYSGRTGRYGSVEGALQRNPTPFFDLLNKYHDDSSAIFSPIHSTFKAGFDFLLSKPAEKVEPFPIYTYVLLDNSLRFSRTGAGMVVDMSSKHALHARAAPEVFYAGEFWIEPGEMGPVLYIDNNSGTFAPPKKDLFRMGWVMQANFPGMQVVLLDYQDPEWKRRRQRE